MKCVGEIRPAILLESARWGDAVVPDMPYAPRAITSMVETFHVIRR